jgi:hypothetical protein
MNPRCPHPDEWLRLLDGELTENRGAELRAHAGGCAACARALQQAETLLVRLAAPVPGVPSPGSVAALMARLDQPLPAARPRRRVVLWSGAGIAAAAAVALLLLRPPAREEAGDFTPRGGPVAWSSAVGVELWAVEAPLRRVGPGSLLAAGTPVVATASNGSAAPAYLLAFALDGRGEVHWLYPAFLDARTDPLAVRLEPGTPRRALPDGAVLEGLPPGPLRLVTIVSRTPLAVSAVERLAPGEREPAALAARFTEARVEVVPVRLEPSPAAPPGRAP